tara:strand:+ start:55 stop:411 length:357 start_codon:yes stop_codon:yes gene_type:complete
MASHNDLGKEGELIAQKFLIKKGFKILNCNWRHLRYEVDIIALDKDFLVFVEVKTRSSFRYGFPDEAVNYRKEKMLIEAAEIYLEQKDLYNEVRFDIVSVVKNEKDEKVYHIVDAFQG